MACLFAGGIATGHYLVTRDPYEVRVFNDGGLAYEAGDYTKAEECFQQAASAATSDDLLADALFWRGRACWELGADSKTRRDLARTCLEEAARLRQNGETFAFSAYACAWDKHESDCIYNSAQAIKADIARAEVYNNLGYLHWQKDNYEKSLEVLAEAIKLKPELNCAYHMRARAQLSYDRAQQRPVDPKAVRDIEKVLEAGTGSARAYYDAALIYSRLDGDRDRDKKLAVDYLLRAYELGYNPKVVRTRLKEFLPEAEIEKALAPNVPVAPRDERFDLLAHPLPNQRFPYR
jgi:tetratricopeptide (TPR) repeat protein